MENGGVGLLFGMTIAGCASSTPTSRHPAKSLQESKLTIEEAHAILSHSGSDIKSFGTGPSWGFVTAIATVRRFELELRGPFVPHPYDSNNGIQPLGLGSTFIMRVPFTGAPRPLTVSRQGPDGVYVEFTQNVWLKLYSSEKAQQFADALQAIRDYAAKGMFIGQDEADSFAQVVTRYQGTNPKPVLTEEARKLKVQAAFAVGKKQYTQAIARYEEALTIAPWWADGHFNRALLLGEAEHYADAVSEMKKYLALEPNAQDARAAQDKLYQWEDEAKTAKIHVTINDRAPEIH